MFNLVINLIVLGIISQSCTGLINDLDNTLENDIASKLKDPDDLLKQNQSTNEVHSRFYSSPYPETLTDGIVEFPIPYHVSIQMKSGNKYQHICAGTIVDESFVLTAGHCFHLTKNPERLSVVVGSNQLSTKKGQRYNVSKIIIHNNYEPLQGWDIGLVKVHPKFVFNGKNLDKININSTGSVNEEVNTFMVGWGRSNSTEHDLEIVSFRTIKNNVCKKRGFKYITETELCAISYQGRGACDGDSGGPLVSSDLKTQLGILSYGRELCARGKIYAFTYLLPLRKWINTHIQRYR